MVPHSRTPVRAHRLRPLNQPRPVVVQLNDRELPIAVAAPQPADSGASGSESGLQVQTRAHDPEPPTPVVFIGEIWRVDDEWWRQPISRRYIEVVLVGGRHVVLYQDLNTGEWFEQSI